MLPQVMIPGMSMCGFLCSGRWAALRLVVYKAIRFNTTCFQFRRGAPALNLLTRCALTRHGTSRTNCVEAINIA